MSKFTAEQKKFIVKSFARNNSATQVRREFLLANKIQGRKRDHYHLKDFSRINDHFEKNGSILKTPVKRTKTKRTNENLQKIQDMLEEKVQFSVRNAAPKLSFSTSTVWRLLRFESKAKFYRPSTVQPLTEAHMEQRRKFCSWLLEEPADFTNKVVWTDEKIFVLNQRPNRKNDGVWCKENPHDLVQTNDRNGQKIMIFVAIVDGQIPIVHAFDKSQTVNGACYLEFLKEVVWPALRYKTTRKGYWWMQDGAPPHCTNLVKDFLLEKFQDRVISRGTPIIWPAHSPDLNPLDFHFWGVAQQQVYKEYPETIENLIDCVKSFAARYDSSVIERVAANVVKRAKLCLDANGGHFQHLLK